MVSTQKMSFFASFLFIAVLLPVVAAVHRVGGDFGWNLPPTPTFFSEWASNKTFFVGDFLVFNSSANETHNYAMPESQAEFDGCVKPGLFFETVSSVSFNRPGRKYFICNVGNHCNLGMKFAIDILPKPGSIAPNAALKIVAFPTLLLLFITIITNFFFFV
ncbi:cucumber peeling cupredoxin-like [Benincasa hispida]|uniref:cucumber peeling cupredoxin-like n=1 Tax=Benincasa hispida TaxID=102211 RepID=UPI001902975F|nr:cucumber peeling cupredoxin-like [Benincasa hispida]